MVCGCQCGFAGRCPMSHARVTRGHQRLVQKAPGLGVRGSRQSRTGGGLKCEQHDCVCPLSDWHWPKIPTFSRWLKSLVRR